MGSEAAAATLSPIREVILKVHERCNLACDYCYVYEAADQRWRGRPISMDPATVERAAQRVAEHVHAHQLDAVRVVLHGGEPLLAGVGAIDDALTRIRAAIDPRVRVDFSVQTNGVLLDERFLAVFHRHGVQVGISTDGDRTAHDRHRRYRDGRGSYDAVQDGIDLMAGPAHRSLYAGLLCTIDLDNDPEQTLSNLLASAPPRIDLLLPHGNHAYPPPGLHGRGDDREGVPTPYGDWLIAAFDAWCRRDDAQLQIRLFESIIALSLGGSSQTETVGLGDPASVVIESDGSIEGNDALKITGPEGGAISMSVFSHSFDDVIKHPDIQAGRQGRAGLSAQCQACPVVGVCGGGLYAHRFSTEDGFARPSVYCADLYRLIGHIQARMEGLDPAAVGAVAA